MLWIVLALMTVAAGGALLLPYLRPRQAATPRAAYDLEIYRDQLAEVERDQARGLIEPGEAKAARLEIARRALAADAAVKTETPKPDGDAPKPWRRAPLIAVAAAGAAPLLALAVYLALGSPELPSHRFMAAHVEHGQDDAELVAKLEAKLKEHPEDAKGWVLLARSYEAMGRADDAVKAWREALKRTPNPAELASPFGEALVQAADGTVTPEAETQFNQALAADPLDPRARYYLGLAKAQAGESRAALQTWTDLLAVSPPDAPWLPVVHKEIARVAGEAKIDPASVTASPEAQKLAEQAKAAAPAPQPGGTSPEMPPGMPPGAAAIQNMPPEQRQAFIRSMVDQLAAKLESNPNDVDGWLRLGRARHVLGEEDKSLAAYEKAASLAPNRLDVQAAYGDALFGEVKPGETLPPKFVAVMRHVLELDPNYGEALWFVGVAEAQAGHNQAAIALWQRLLDRIPKDAKERSQIQAQIDKLKKEPD